MLRLLGLKSLTLPLLIGGVGFIIASVWTAYHLHTNALDEVSRLKQQLKTCNTRIIDILEDKKSDATVTDPNVYPVPDHWMLEF